MKKEKYKAGKIYKNEEEKFTRMKEKFVRESTEERQIYKNKPGKTYRNGEGKIYN